MLETYQTWANEAIFYHIYPLGFCGAPARNDFSSPFNNRLTKLTSWLDYIQNLGATALYLGPVFESTAHGYDTADYFRVDRRLGDNQALAEFSRELHQRGMRLVLDGVFNHVGRDFWAFRDVLTQGRNSNYCDWFYGLDFNGRSPYNDSFQYQGWAGHFDLVKLNLHNPAVKKYLFEAVAYWVTEFQIDGLRLDAADHIDFEFLKELATFCRQLRPDFWLVGEVVHGDYNLWANSEMLDATTNYECYKGLWSSHVDRNYFEIAYSLNRQFGENGLYKDLALYNFADNHDVNRVASSLTSPSHLYPLYCLLFSIPGIPAIYYGSEWAIRGERSNIDDYALRPCLDLAQLYTQKPDLLQAIRRLANVRHNSTALQRGSYRQIVVQAEQLVFARQTATETVIVAVNASTQTAALDIALPELSGRQLTDLLNPGQTLQISAQGQARLEIWPCWARILRVDG